MHGWWDGRVEWPEGVGFGFGVDDGGRMGGTHRMGVWVGKIGRKPNGGGVVGLSVLFDVVRLWWAFSLLCTLVGAAEMSTVKLCVSEGAGFSDEACLPGSGVDSTPHICHKDLNHPLCPVNPTLASRRRSGGLLADKVGPAGPIGSREESHQNDRLPERRVETNACGMSRNGLPLANTERHC
jgi:hypothetical protein